MKSREIYSAPPPPHPFKKNLKTEEFEGVMGEKKKGRKKTEGKGKKKRDIGVKNRETYFVSLYYIGLYDHQKKSAKKQGRISKIFKIFRVAIVYTPDEKLL